MLCNSLAAVLNGLTKLMQLVYKVAFELQLRCQFTSALQVYWMKALFALGIMAMSPTSIPYHRLTI